MQERKRVTLTWVLLIAGMLLTLGVGERAQATTLFVANNGLDTSTCGGNHHPCRSISQAVARANAGDQIMVGPGRYGDLNRNGIFGEPGEEVAEAGFGCFCMIHLDKRVTLVSRDGALVTVLDAGGAVATTVRISASGVVLGRPGHGFLLTGAGGGTLGVGCCVGASNVTVAGNIASGNSGDGIAISGSANRVSGNLAIGNGNFGFSIFGSGSTVRGNVASANGNGIAISGIGHLLRENVASGNSFFGVFVFDSGRQIELFRNAILGNGASGIQLTPMSDATIRRNNIYGNSGCGLINASERSITANNNFWGAATGPGADPADNVCDFVNSKTVFMPFGTREFTVPLQPVAIQGQLSTSDIKNQD